MFGELFQGWLAGGAAVAVIGALVKLGITWVKSRAEVTVAQIGATKGQGEELESRIQKHIDRLEATVDRHEKRIDELEADLEAARADNFRLRNERQGIDFRLDLVSRYLRDALAYGAQTYDRANQMRSEFFRLFPLLSRETRDANPDLGAACLRHIDTMPDHLRVAAKGELSGSKEIE